MGAVFGLEHANIMEHLSSRSEPPGLKLSSEGYRTGSRTEEMICGITICLDR